MWARGLSSLPLLIQRADCGMIFLNQRPMRSLCSLLGRRGE